MGACGAVVRAWGREGVRLAKGIISLLFFPFAGPVVRLLSLGLCAVVRAWGREGDYIASFFSFAIFFNNRGIHRCFLLYPPLNIAQLVQIQPKFVRILIIIFGGLKF